MREILFRGKRADNGKWVYGVPIKDQQGEMVIVESVFECEEYNCRGANCWCVDEKTVGQYTGLTANGKRIFEGDIVDVEYDINYVGVAVQRIGKFKVVFSDGCFMKEKISGSGLFHFIPSDVTTILGNIYDNSELLKGESNGTDK